LVYTFKCIYNNENKGNHIKESYNNHKATFSTERNQIVIAKIA